MSKISFKFPFAEYIFVSFALCIILTIGFFNIIFLDQTLSASAFSAGSMPNGPYSYAGRTFNDQPVIDPWASALQYEPELYLAYDIVRSLNLPLWNPYIGTGVPLAGDMISAVFFPLNFIIYIVSKDNFWQWMDIILLLRLFISGFFTYCFMREICLNKSGSLISASAFMLNGYLILYINMAHLNVEILLPALLFFIERLFKNQNATSCLYSSLIIGLSIIGGMPESTLFSFLFVCLYYLFRIYMERIYDLKGIYKSITWLLASFLLGIMLSSLVTIPFIEYYFNSWHFHKSTLGVYHYVFDFDTISLLIPYFFGPIKGIWGSGEVYEVLPYIGITPLFLAFSAITIKKGITRSLITFFYLFSAFYILKTYGAPIINSIGLLPLFNVSIFPKYCFLPFAFSISVLAGIGFENLSRLSFKRILFQSAIIISLIFILFFGNIYGTKVDQLMMPNVVYGIFQAAIIILLINIILYFYFKHLTKTFASFVINILILLLILELVIYIPSDRAERLNPFENPPYVDFIQRDNELFRVIGLNSILMPNVASSFKIYDVRELFPMKIKNYRNFIYYTIDPFEKRFLATNLEIVPETLNVLNFLNVKYILSDHYLTLHKTALENDMINKIFKDAKILGNKSLVMKGTFNGRSMLFQHPPSTIIYELSIPSEAAYLNFSFGLDPRVWSPDKGDGVLFELIVIDDLDAKTQVLSRYVDPKNNLSDRRYFQESIDIKKYRNNTIKLVFRTYPANSDLYDWAEWVDLRLESSPLNNGQNSLENPLELVYDDEIKIYKNTAVLPRSYVIESAIIENSSEDFLNKVQTGEFDFKRDLLLEKSSPIKHENLTEGNKSSILSDSKIISYGANEIIITANMTRQGYLILTDVYYPGWNCYVDGNRTDILIANYAFRAVSLSEGNHIIKFIYSPLSFVIGLFISGIVFLFILIYLVKNLIKKQD